MTQRDTVFIVVGVLGAAALALLLIVATIVRQGAPQRSVLIGRSPAPSARPLAELERRLPPELRFLAPVVPLQRGVSDVAREGAGLFLVLLLVSGTLILGREQVVRVKAAISGDWVDQIRVLGVGIGVFVALASAAVVGAVFILARLAAGGSQVFVFGLQWAFALGSVVALVVAGIALVGYTAASWQLGSAFLSRPAWRTSAERVPAAVTTLVTAALVYLAAQLPVVGPFVGALAIAYSLGAFVLARVGSPREVQPA